MTRNLNAVLISLLGISATAGAVGAQGTDSCFAALQARGKVAMGVDQYTSTHRFDALADGGRIELQRNADDPAGVAQIRQHLREIAAAFQSGDFTTPAFVHMQEVPGASVMAAQRERITYTFGELPRGGEVRIVTTDPDALQAIHDFMAFQRQDHRAGGMEHGAMQHSEGMRHPTNHCALQHSSHGAVQPGQGTQDPTSHGAMNHGAMQSCHGMRHPMQHCGMRSGQGMQHPEDGAGAQSGGMKHPN